MFENLLIYYASLFFFTALFGLAGASAAAGVPAAAHGFRGVPRLRRRRGPVARPRPARADAGVRHHPAGAAASRRCGDRRGRDPIRVRRCIRRGTARANRCADRLDSLDLHAAGQARER